MDLHDRIHVCLDRTKEAENAYHAGHREAAKLHLAEVALMVEPYRDRPESEEATKDEKPA